MQDQFKLVRDDYSNIEKAFDGDLWQRKELANRLTDYVSRLKVGATIAIDAEWGSGKTWFVNHWKKQLEDRKFDVVYLDAFANDYLEDPFLTISMEIANKINVDPSLVKKFKEKLTNVYHSILPNLPILIWSLATSLISASYFGKTAAEALKNSTENAGDFGEESAELLNEKLKEHLSAQVENYEQEKQTLIYFKKALAEIAEKLDHPLIFIIDELDRCKPEFSIRLIERIKHFFDTPNIIFVLAVNKKQLSESINNFYGFNDVNDYLEKFIDFNIKLPIPHQYEYGQLIENYVQTHGFVIRNTNVIKMLFIYFQPNARQVIKILQKLNFLNIISERKNSYACLHMLVHDLGLNKDFNDEFASLKVLMEKVKIFYTTRLSFNSLDPSDPKLEEKSLEKLKNLEDSLHLFARLYESQFITKKYDEVKQFKNALLPTERSLHLWKDWDNYLNSGFIINSI